MTEAQAAEMISALRSIGFQVMFLNWPLTIIALCLVFRKFYR